MKLPAFGGRKDKGRITAQETGSDLSKRLLIYF